MSFGLEFFSPAAEKSLLVLELEAAPGALNWASSRLVFTQTHRTGTLYSLAMDRNFWEQVVHNHRLARRKLPVVVWQQIGHRPAHRVSIETGVALRLKFLRNGTLACGWIAEDQHRFLGHSFSSLRTWGEPSLESLSTTTAGQIHETQLVEPATLGAW